MIVISIAIRRVVRGVRWALLLGSTLLACGTGRSGPAPGDASEAGDAIAAGDVANAGDTGQGPCPQLILSVGPGVVTVGSEVNVSASLSPPSPTTSSFTWTATSGQFTSSVAPLTRFSCNVAGVAVVTVQVVTAGCVQSSSANVQCVPYDPDAATNSGPCMYAGEVGCVACTGSPGGVCTPTEMTFVQHDPSGGCYACLLSAGCLDDPEAGITGNECDDLTGDATSGPTTGAWKPSLCRDTIACILGTSCAAPLATTCYCGSAAAPCDAPGVANGVCLIQETSGLETTDPQTVTSSFDSKSLAAGVANAIFACAANAHCSTCLGASDAGPGSSMDGAATLDSAATGDGAVTADGAGPSD
jgi:hypothetical protein